MKNYQSIFIPFAMALVTLVPSLGFSQSSKTLDNFITKNFDFHSSSVHSIKKAKIILLGDTLHGDLQLATYRNQLINLFTKASDEDGIDLVLMEGLDSSVIVPPSIRWQYKNNASSISPSVVVGGWDDFQLMKQMTLILQEYLKTREKLDQLNQPNGDCDNPEKEAMIKQSEELAQQIGKIGVLDRNNNLSHIISELKPLLNNGTIRRIFIIAGSQHFEEWSTVTDNADSSNQQDFMTMIKSGKIPYYHLNSKLSDQSDLSEEANEQYAKDIVEENVQYDQDQPQSQDNKLNLLFSAIGEQYTRQQLMREIRQFSAKKAKKNRKPRP